MIAAILLSLSRMGVIASLVGLGICGAGFLLSRGEPSRKRGWSRLAIVGAAFLGFVAALIYFPPDALVRRFGTTDIRTEIWKESLPLARDFWAFGCGSGGYEPVFMKDKKTDPMFRIDYAHNDYLQRFIELGLAGSLAAAYLIFAVLREARRAAMTRSSTGGRALAIASIAGLGAILLHSFVDFNLYIPANGMVFAWVCGIVASSSSVHDSPYRRTVDVESSRLHFW